MAPGAIGQPYQEGLHNMPRDLLIQLRGGTAAEWTAADPILAENEPAFETDTGALKIGDGTTPFSELSSITGGVSVPDQDITRQIPYVPVYPNLLNSGFESGTMTGWSALDVGSPTGGSLTIDGTEMHSGVGCCKVDFTGGDNDLYGIYQADLDLRDVTHIKIYAKSPSNCRLGVAFTDTPEYLDFTLTSALGSSWAQYTIEIPEENRTEGVTISIGILHSLSGAVTAYLDDISFTTITTGFGYIEDVDEYILDRVAIGFNVPDQSTMKQVMYRQITGETGDYAWIPDLDTYIDDEIEDYLNLPTKTDKKQVPYRPESINTAANPDMEDGPLVNPNHFFDTSDVYALINENHNFVSDTARDDYFTTHPGELSEGLLIYSWYRFQKYISSTWTDQNTDELIEDIADDYFTAHPGELSEGVYRCLGELYQQYLSAIWEDVADETTITGGWLPYSLGAINLVLAADTSEKHGGSKSLKATYGVLGSDWYGGGIQQHGIDFTDGQTVKVWLKGAGDAVGLSVKVDYPFTSEEDYNLTSAWAQYSFFIPEAARGTDKTLAIVIGDPYLNVDDCTVYFDDVEVITGSGEALEFIDDIDTYFDGQYCRFRGVSSTTPSDPIAGDIWIDTTSGSVPKIYGGSSWISLT